MVLSIRLRKLVMWAAAVLGHAVAALGQAVMEEAQCVHDGLREERGGTVDERHHVVACGVVQVVR